MGFAFGDAVGALRGGDVQGRPAWSRKGRRAENRQNSMLVRRRLRSARVDALSRVERQLRRDLRSSNSFRSLSRPPVLCWGLTFVWATEQSMVRIAQASHLSTLPPLQAPGFDGRM